MATPRMYRIETLRLPDGYFAWLVRAPNGTIMAAPFSLIPDGSGSWLWSRSGIPGWRSRSKARAAAMKLVAAILTGHIVWQDVP